MVRNDFVSNSSSCSFIITNPKDIASKISLQDLDLLFSTIPSGCRVSYDNGSVRFHGKNNFSQRLLDYCDNKDSKLKIKKEDKDWILIEGIDSIYDLSIPDVDFLTDLFKESESVDFDHGLDDCGEKSGYVGAIVGVLIDHIPEVKLDSENFDSNTIVSIFKKLKEKKNGKK